MCLPDRLKCGMNAAKADWEIKMLFDGKCPVCSREVALLRKHNTRGLIAFEDIAETGFEPGKYGLTLPQVVGRDARDSERWIGRSRN